MKEKRCTRCRTWLRYGASDREVACGECGARYTIERSTRASGTALQAGILRALRGALASSPDACKACQGTGCERPVAAERAVSRGAAGTVRRCTRCKGTGTTT